MKKILTSLLDNIYIMIFGKKKFLIKKGAKIGNGTRIWTSISSFGSEPYLIEIGDECLISDNCCFMTHDGGVSVLNNLDMFEKKMDKLGRIKVGDNVFVGKNSTIMPNITIGNNVVIGLGSIVTKDVPDNCVVAGVPAKIIKSIDEYKNQLKNIYPTGNMNFKEKRDYCNKNNI